MFLEFGSWKDPSNEFKKTLKLTGVPTLLRYGTVSRLWCPFLGSCGKAFVSFASLTLEMLTQGLVNMSGLGCIPHAIGLQQLMHLLFCLVHVKLVIAIINSDYQSSQLIKYEIRYKMYACVCSALQPQKLVEEECFKPDLVRMMFTEDQTTLAFEFMLSCLLVIQSTALTYMKHFLCAVQMDRVHVYFIPVVSRVGILHYICE